MFKKIFSLVLVVIFLVTGVMPARGAELLPPVGQMVPFSAAFKAPELVGVRVYADQPFRFDFMLDKGDGPVSDGGRSLQDESQRLIKYFLASLTLPEKDLWVNLSPDEKDRIIPTAFGLTEMGRDLLGQDYLLKQVASSAFNPDEILGKTFWDEVYRQAQEKFGTTDIPLDTRHRVWIVPSDVTVYEKSDVGKKAAAAMVVDAKLKVMLEVDYLALAGKAAALVSVDQGGVEDMAKQVMRTIIIPALEKEVNEGTHFARLRQVYHSFILAAWYKKKLKGSIVAASYVDQGKVRGVDTGEPDAPQRIYDQYVESFKKGVFNFIKEEQGAVGEGLIPRKYFSGGIVMDSEMEVVTDQVLVEQAFGAEKKKDLFVISSAGEPVEQNVTPVVTDDSMKTEIGRRETITGALTSKALFDPEVVREISKADMFLIRKVVANGDNEELFREFEITRSGTQEVKRSAFWRLRVPVDYGGRRYRGAYVKGILLSPKDTNVRTLDKSKAGQPTEVMYYPDGKSMTSPALPFPEGGEFLYKIVAEYKNTLLALKNGARTNLPVGYAEFTNRTFFVPDALGKPVEMKLGCLVVLTEDADPVRLWNDFNEKVFKFSDWLKGHFDWKEKSTKELKLRFHGPDVKAEADVFRDKIRKQIGGLGTFFRDLHRWAKHSNPNFDNVGLTGPQQEDFLLVDLPGLVPWERIGKKERLWNLLFDFTVIVRNLALLSGEDVKGTSEISRWEREERRKDKLFLGMGINFMEEFFKRYFINTYNDPRFSDDFDLLRAAGLSGLYDSLSVLFVNGIDPAVGTDSDLGKAIQKIFSEEFRQEFQKPYEGDDKAVATASVVDPAERIIEARIEAMGRGLGLFIVRPQDIKELREFDVEGNVSDEMFFKVEDFVEAFRNGTPFVFDLTRIADDDDPVEAVTLLLNAIYLKMAMGDNGTSVISYSFMELVKNALIHGNKFDLKLPLYLYTELNEAGEIYKLHVIDMGSKRQIDQDIVKRLKSSGLIKGMGVDTIRSDFQYQLDLFGEGLPAGHAVVTLTKKTPRSSDGAVLDLAVADAVKKVKMSSQDDIRLSRLYHEMNNLLMVFSGNLEIVEYIFGLPAETVAQAALINEDLKKYLLKNQEFRDSKDPWGGKDERGGVEGYDKHFRYMLEGVQAAVDSVNILAQEAALSGDNKTWSVLQETGNDLLGFLRGVCEGGSPAFDRIMPKDVEVGPLLDHFVREFSFDQHIHFVQDVDKDLHILADPVILPDVFINLIKNSLEAIGSNEGMITVSAKHDGDFVRISIKDTGSGITTEDMKHIFERGHTTKIHGSGIGLDVVKTIVKAHHGEIWAESLGKDKGAEFVLRLPINKSVSDKGGIDLGAGTMDMKIREESGEFRFDLNPDDLKAYQDAPGLTPVIFSIQPLESLPQFLGSPSAR